RFPLEADPGEPKTRDTRRDTDCRDLWRPAIPGRGPRIPGGTNKTTVRRVRLRGLRNRSRPNYPRGFHRPFPPPLAPPGPGQRGKGGEPEGGLDCQTGRRQAAERRGDDRDPV